MLVTRGRQKPENSNRGIKKQLSNDSQRYIYSYIVLTHDDLQKRPRGNDVGDLHRIDQLTARRKNTSKNEILLCT